MAITHVVSVGKAGSGVAGTYSETTSPSKVTTGANLLIGVGEWYAGYSTTRPFTFSDAAGNSFVQDFFLKTVYAPLGIQVMRASGSGFVASASETMTISYPATYGDGGGMINTLAFSAFAGVDTVNPLDQAPTYYNAYVGYPPPGCNPGSQTPSVGGCLAVCVVADNANYSGIAAPTGYSTGGSINNGGVSLRIFYKIKGAADLSAENPTDVQSYNDTTVALFLYRPAATGGVKKQSILNGLGGGGRFFGNPLG